MPTLIMRRAYQGFQLHQKNWGAALCRSWRQWWLRWARHSQCKGLRDLADDPHLSRRHRGDPRAGARRGRETLFELTDCIHFL
jgi:hypothetical protein